MKSKPSVITSAFFALLNAGLWEKEVDLGSYGTVDYRAIYSLACQQQVVGLVAAGLSHLAGNRPSKADIAPFAGDTFRLEQRNSDMNAFIAKLFSVFRKNNVPAILVKGQGIAQCYERPLWRACGDIDILLDEEHYFDAKTNMMKKASLVTEEDDSRLHVALVMNSWVVELHGSLFHKFFPRLNTTLADLQSRLHQQRRVRLWNNDGVDIALPDPDLDVVFVFSHILEHFFEKGVGLRQICDWCRLLYTHRDTVDTHLLEQRLRQMDIVSEWKAFAAFAVLYLDMPAGFMPLYSPASRWARKAHRILRYVLKYGNFGHNRDTTYIFNASFLKKKAISFRDMVGETVAQLRIFPKDTLTILRHKMADSISRAMRGVR